MDTFPVWPHVSREFSIYKNRFTGNLQASAAVVVDGFIAQIAEKPAEYRGFAFLYEDRARVEDIMVRALYWAFAMKPAYKSSRIVAIYMPSSIQTLQAYHQISTAHDMRNPDKIDFAWTITLRPYRTYDD